MKSDKLKLLQEPFDKEDLEWRVQQCGVKNSKPWVIAVAYVTNRAIQQRLDEVLGLDGWQNEYRDTPKSDGFLCGISIKGEDGKWITKWDGAEYTNIESLKGGLSGSMKRAAVQFGIGRYLYNLKAEFAAATLIDSRRDAQRNYINKKIDGVTFHIDWADPELPLWALPSVKAEEFSDQMNKCENIAELKKIFGDSLFYANSFGRKDLKEVFTKAKDEAKERLDLVAQESVEVEYNKAVKWVNQQINALALIPEESSVARVCQSYRDRLDNMSDGQYYETKELYLLIDKAEQKRIHDIQNKNTEENKNE